MERVKNSSTLRIAFDVAMGVFLLAMVAVFFGGTLDLPITVLIALIIIIGTALVVRQNHQIFQALYEQDRI